MKRAWWLFALGAIAAFLSFPFPPPDPFTFVIVEILVALMVYAGLWFWDCLPERSEGPPAQEHGSPDRRGSLAALGMTTPKRALYSLLIGAASGAVVLALLPLAGLQSRIIKEASIPLWKWLIIAFDSSVLEEIIFRLFVVSFVAWLFNRFIRREPSIWIALAASALTFGAAHLGRWLDAGPIVITAVMIVNGLIAIVLGLIYVKWGIEAAILGHFAGDVVVHIIGPHFFI